MSFWKKIFSAEGGSASGGKKEKKDEAGLQKKEKLSPAAPLEKRGEKKEIIPGKIIAGVIRSSRVTEKSSGLAKENKYIFLVNTAANKLEIARALEARYGVTIDSVNIVNTPGKERRRGRQIGWKPDFKKAIVKVKEGQSIEIQ